MTEIDGTSGRPVSTTGVHILYILHAVAPFTLWSLSFFAVIAGAFMRDSDRGTYLESHYSWLLRTFLWGLLWLVIGTVIFAITLVGLLFLWIPWGVLTIWYLYRVVRGWLLLNEARPAPN
jgi:uncharacterized membrane protein